jgi:hypothetical protein
MKIYISGRITGEENADKKFKDAENLLLRMYPNAIIYNPMNITSPKLNQEDWGEEGIWSYYMHQSIKLMMECKTIYMLSNWSKSRGATIEHDLAWKLNMTILYQEDVEK